MSVLSSENLLPSAVAGAGLLLWDVFIEKTPLMTSSYDAAVLAGSVFASKAAIDLFIPANVMQNLFGGATQSNNVFKPILNSIVAGFVYDYIYNSFLRPKNNLLANRSRDKSIFIGIAVSYVALMFGNPLVGYFTKPTTTSVRMY